jgi:hypothetical protein
VSAIKKRPNARQRYWRREVDTEYLSNIDLIVGCGGGITYIADAQSSKIRRKIAPRVGGTSRNPQSGEHKRRLSIIVASARPQAGASGGERLRLTIDRCRPVEWTAVTRPSLVEFGE